MHTYTTDIYKFRLINYPSNLEWLGFGDKDELSKGSDSQNVYNLFKTSLLVCLHKKTNYILLQDI